MALEIQPNEFRAGKIAKDQAAARRIRVEDIRQDSEGMGNGGRLGGTTSELE
jgi:hypothetical protein